MPLATGFCFIKISKAIPYTQWYIKSRSTSQMKLVFYYILQIVPLPRPDRRPSDSGSESTTESEEESEVSLERLGRLCCCKLCNCYPMSVKKSVLLDSLVLSGTIIIS